MANGGMDESEALRRRRAEDEAVAKLRQIDRDDVVAQLRHHDGAASQVKQGRSDRLYDIPEVEGLNPDTDDRGNEDPGLPSSPMPLGPAEGAAAPAPSPMPTGGPAISVPSGISYEVVGRTTQIMATPLCGTNDLGLMNNGEFEVKHLRFKRYNDSGQLVDVWEKDADPVFTGRCV